MDKILCYLGLVPSKSPTPAGVDSKQDSLNLYKLAREAWSFDPRAANLLIADTIISYVAGYIDLTIQARLTTQAIRWLQRDPSFQRNSFMKLILLKLLLYGLHVRCRKYVERTKTSMRVNVNRNRTLKLVETYLRLPFSQQVKEGVRSRFRAVVPDVSSFSTTFEETIETIGETAETCFILGVAGTTLWRTSRFAALIMAGFTCLYAATAIFSVKSAPENDISQWKSVAQRRIQSFRDYAFNCRESIQDLRLYGSRNWLVTELNKGFQNDPVLQNGLRPSQYGLKYVIEVLEVIGFPALVALLRLGVDLDSYLLAQMSLSTVRGNLSNLQWRTENLYRTAVPFAKKYLECISMASEKSPLEICDSETKGGEAGEKLNKVERIELRSISFSYENAEDRLEKAEPDETEEFESISSNGIEDEESTAKLRIEKFEEKFEEFTAQGSLHDGSEEKVRHLALCDVNFIFESGKVYSIVGRNGSGKSTLMNILGKLYEPTKGQVLVNGIPLSQVPEAIWSQTLVMVPQNTSFIWNLTFREIISFGLSGMENQESVIEEEAQRCGVTNFVKLDAFYGDKEYSISLPGVENERWVDEFSGGEWQSIALARAFVRKASTVVILDEPSAALDPQKEHQLFERLRKEREGRITIFISHRLQTCRASDCILVMDRGLLVQRGSHKDLLNDESGIYAQLYRLQNEDLLEM